MESFDTNNDSNLSWDEIWASWTAEDDDHDDHDDHDEDNGTDDDHDDHDDHHDEEEALMVMFNMSDADGNQLLNMSELGAFIELVEEFEEDHIEMTPDTVMEHFDANNDSNISWDEFWNGWLIEDDDHDEHGEENGTDDHDEHHDEEEVLMGMFNMSDVDGNQLLNMSELSAFIELMGDGHDDHDEHDGPVGYATIHIEEEGDYGFALPMGVEFFILMGEGGHAGHDDHDDHGGGHDDHGDHGDDSAMVCYDISTHTANSSYENQADCEGAGLMWVAGNSGPGGQDDHHEGACHNTTTHENYDSNETDCEAAGHMWVEDHEGHEGECHNTSTHENYESTESECEAAGHVWMDDHSEQEIVADGDEEAFDFDPHSWLDPLSYKTQVGVVLDALIAAFPSGEAAFTENAAAYMGQLDSLHSDFDSAFGSTNTCTGTSIAANHNAYAYMAERYDLEFVTVHGLDPEGEPSAADILEVIEKIEEEGITVFFVEEYTSQAAVAAIVEQTNGIEIKILYTMELQPSDSEDNYISMMRKNLEGLKSGLGC